MVGGEWWEAVFGGNTKCQGCFDFYADAIPFPWAVCVQYGAE